MRALLQRVSYASVSVDGEVVGEIGAGLLIFACAMNRDTDADADRLAAKISRLRIFRDPAGKMNRSILDTGGAALLVSQFTLAADTSRGNRPGFSAAAPPDKGELLCELLSDRLRGQGITVKNGVFGADMEVRLSNDGPVTIWIDTDD